MKIQSINHIAIIASDIDRSIVFYVNVLGFSVIRKIYREERKSWKVDLALHTSFRHSSRQAKLSTSSSYLIELFTFPDAPARPSYPEALGLRHLAFSVPDLDAAVRELNSKGVETEPIRTDSVTGNRCVFFHDPDGLPIELVEEPEGRTKEARKLGI